MQGFFTLTAVQAGLYICISAVMAGHLLYTKVGPQGGIIGIGVGSLILWLLSLIFVRLSIVRRKVLIDIVQDYFGLFGTRICGLAMGISLLGWFGLQTELMAKSIVQIYPAAPQNLIICLLGALVTVNVIHGMKWIGRLADLSVPFLLAMMLYIGWCIYDPTINIPSATFQWQAISLTIAFSLSGIIDIPTYFCESKKPLDAYLAATVVYLIILPLMAFLGYGLALYTGADDFVCAIMGIGGQIWQILVVLFIVFAGWTTNNGNLYSASLALASCIPLQRKVLVSALGAIGSGLAVVGLLDRFAETLSIIGILTAALGATIMLRFISDRFQFIKPTVIEQRIYQAFTIVGGAVGALADLKVYELTTFGYIDSFITTSILCFIYEATCRLK